MRKGKKRAIRKSRSGNTTKNTLNYIICIFPNWLFNERRRASLFLNFFMSESILLKKG